MSISATLLKTAMTFFVLLILTRFLGKKQVSQLTFFNYVTGITIGSIAADIVCNANEPFVDELLGLIFWCVLTEGLDFIGLKSGFMRKLFDGQPTIVIKKGTIVKKSLQSARLNMDDVSMLLREQSIFSITEVEYAILEPNGNLSVMKKSPKQQVVREDMNLPPPANNYLPSEIIVDGKLIAQNLKEFNLDEAWLVTQLNKNRIYAYKEVLYAEIQADGSLYIVKS